MRIIVVLIVIILAGIVISSCKMERTALPAVRDSLALRYTVLGSFPHNDKAFTEGLVFNQNKLLESTGLNDQSWIAEVDQSSGEHNKKVILTSEYFGEGITVMNNKIYHLTYKEKQGFIYNAATYNKIGEFNYNTEGWGLTHNGHHLIMSTGSEKLYYLDTTNFKVVRTLTVTEQGQRLKNLNELEYIDGHIFANVYETSYIVKIDPATGKVVGRIDLSTLANEIKRTYPNTFELNGIAYKVPQDALVVTGKYWPKSYLIKLQ